MRANVRAGAYSWAQKEFEKLNADEWMETMWLGYRNNLMSNPDLKYSMEAANAYATKHLVENYLGYNVYDKPKDQLFDANGKSLPKCVPVLQKTWAGGTPCPA